MKDVFLFNYRLKYITNVRKAKDTRPGNGGNQERPLFSC